MVHMHTSNFPDGKV